MVMRRLVRLRRPGSLDGQRVSGGRVRMTGTGSRLSPFAWRRGLRSSFSLGSDTGVYALFLRSGSGLPGVEPGQEGLLYIGLAANRNGLLGRCHFNARTRNHSPRKSLAALLLGELSLTPILILKPRSPATWGLDAESDARLSAWMHANLELATEICGDPDARETELVGQLSPPLNLTKCTQTPQHRRIWRAREEIMARVKEASGSGMAVVAGEINVLLKPPGIVEQSSADHREAGLRPPLPGTSMDTAEAIAARYELNPKSYRQRLRGCISWYCKPQDWTFPRGTKEWRDMIDVAEEMTKRR